MTNEEKNALLNEQYSKKNTLLTQLQSKDYIGTKIAMGVATREQYAEEITLTETWRAEIEAADREIARLEAIETEEQESAIEPDEA